LALSDNTKIDFSFKFLNDKTLTSISKQVYEEIRSSAFTVYANDVWVDEINSNPSVAETNGIVQKYTLLTLTEDFAVSNHKGWYAYYSSDNLTGWVPPKFGQGYTVRLYDNNDVEISSSDSMDWFWQYNPGYLFIQNSHSYTIPFKVTGYKYIGSKLSEVNSSNWLDPVNSIGDLPSTGNNNGDIRLVLDNNTLYRWNSGLSQWEAISGGGGGIGYWHSPVPTYGDLPASGNLDGDVRYVKNIADTTYGNRIYRWNSSTSSWVMVSPGTHFHDDRYYTKTQLDPSASVGNNVLDDRYYTESELLNGTLDVRYYTSAEVNVFFDKDLGHIHDGTNGQGPKISYNNLTDLPDLTEAYWKAPVATESALPASGNSDGDVRLVLNTSDVFRWKSTGSVWLLISAGVERWELPVPNFIDLPLSSNTNGDIRLVLSENVLYRWKESVSEWQPVTDVKWQENFNLTNGQTVINLTNSYEVGNDEILVFYNGLLQRVTEDYAETSSTSITLVQAGELGDYITVIGNPTTGSYQPEHSYEENVVDITEATNDEIESNSSILPTEQADTLISPATLRGSNILVDIVIDGVEKYDDEWRYFYDSGNTKKLIKFSGTGFGGYDLQENEKIKIKIIKL